MSNFTFAITRSLLVKNVRRSTIFILIVCYHFSFLTQNSDTILLPLFEKKIRGIEKEAGTYVVEFDSLDLTLNQNRTLADLFQNSGAVNTRVSSPGNLAVLSFRGLSGVHTRLDWNGLNLNSPSSGLSDLSTINQALFNKISLRSDAYPSSVISLENDWKKNDKALELAFGLKSFMGRNYGLTYRVGNIDFFSRTHFDYNSADNDYLFKSTNSIGNGIQTRLNSDYRSWNFQQDFGYISRGRSATNTHSGHLWISNFDRNLPGSLFFPSLYANQTDKSVRFAYKWKLEEDALNWTTVIGYLRDRLEYSDAFEDWQTGELIPFNSDYTQRRIHLNSKFNYKLESLHFAGGVELRTMNIESSNYGVIKPETAIAFMGKIQKNWKSARAVFSMKQEFSSVFKVPFNATLGYDKYFAKTRIWASIKRVGRAPIYDDLFFMPGGNPNLSPENGWAYEGGIEHKATKNSSLSLNVYRNEMNNWIQWVPIDTLFNYSPVNYTSVDVNGLRVDYNALHPSGRIVLITKASMTYQKTINNHPLVFSEEPIELLLSPNWIANFTLGIKEGNSTFGYRSRFLSDQFVDEFNTAKLDQSFVHDIFFTTHLANRFRINIQANNLTNLTYFTNTAYPMFGRNFSVDLIYKTAGSEEKETVKKNRGLKKRRGRRW